VKSGQLSVYFVIENIDQIDMLNASIFPLLVTLQPIYISKTQVSAPFQAGCNFSLF
jgi:hypothetical protein